MANVGRPRKILNEGEFEKVTADLKELQNENETKGFEQLPEIFEELEALKATTKDHGEQLENLIQLQSQNGAVISSIGEIEELKAKAAELLAKFEPIKETQTEIEAAQKDIETAEERGQNLVSTCIGLCKTMALQIRNIESNNKDVLEAANLVHKYSFELVCMNERYQIAVASATNDLRKAREKERLAREELAEQRHTVRRLQEDVAEMQAALRKRNFI